MSQSDRAIKKLATQLARLDREVKSWRGAQADYTSIEAGTMDINDSDGNLVSRVGFQEDGSGAVRFFDGPVPPVPSGVTASADGPIIQATWDGSFVDGAEATYDLAYLEVAATQVDDDTNVSFATITAKEGASASVVADVTGDWVVAVRSVSQAGRKSEFAYSGTVNVKIVDLAGEIEAVQASANGKNTIYYSPTEPVPPEGGFNNGDLWFDTSEEGNNTASVWDGSGWVSMEDARLATIIAAQEALESDLQDVQTSVDGKNKITYDPALPPASYVGAVGDTWYRTSGNSMIGFWKWDGAAWVQQELSTTVIPQIDIGAGTFGALKGTRLEAGSVTTDKLLVGDFSNLVDDPALLGPGWSGNVSYSFVYTLQGPGNALFYNGVDGGYVQNGNMFPTMPGTKYVVTARIQNRRTDWVKVHVNWFQHDKTPSAVSVSDGATYDTTAPSAVWSDVQAEVVAPSDARFGVLRITYHSGGGSAYVIRPMVRRMTGATLIEDGAITTDKLAVGAITAESGVIASLDLGTATVGELDGIRIMARTITGDLFSGDAFDGLVFRGNTFVTRDGNGEFSDRGLFFQKPDGTAIFRVPTDGTPISMSASDVQIERAQVDELELNVGRVRSGGLFELSSGVTPPASPPELNSAWNRIVTLQTPTVDAAYVWDGLAYWDEGSGQPKHWLRAINVLTVDHDTDDAIEIYDYDTGVLQRRFNIDLNPNHGFTVMGGIVYVFGNGHGSGAARERKYIDGYDLVSGARVSRHEYNRAIGAKNALGNDGTNLIIGSIWDLELWVHRRDPVTGVQVGSDMRSGPQSWPASGGKDLYGVRINGNDVEVVTPWGARVYLNSNNVLVHKTDSANASGYAGWVLPTHDASGCAWRAGGPYPVDSQGNIYSGSNLASDTTVEVCFTWFDGVNETTPSPSATVALPARNSYTMSFPVRAGLQKRIYIRSGSGLWFRTVAPPELTVATLALIPGGSVELPTVNSFPNADPAIFRSTNGNVVVRGDGSGKWGPLTFNADGTMTSAQIPAWVPLTGFLNQWAPHAGWFPPAYRVWPDGKVEWRGMMSKASGLPDDGQALFTIPAEAMPTSTVSVPVATNTTSRATLLQLDFRPGPGNAAAWPPGRGTYDRVGLDGIYYYKN